MPGNRYQCNEHIRDSVYKNTTHNVFFHPTASNDHQNVQ